MPVEIEKEGKTVSEATISACEELGVSRSDIDVEILKEGSKGVFGIGERLAKVKVTLKSDGVSEKGLKAKKTLENILGYLVENQTVTLMETSDRIKLDINLSDDKGLLIGKRGDTLRALEYIVGRISSRDCETGRDKRVGFRLEGRGFATFTEGSTQNFCNPSGTCTGLSSNDILFQFVINAGVTFRF